MKVRLIERAEKIEDMREIPIGESEFLIGRGPDCDLRLPVSSVSRHHCLLHVTQDSVSVTDLGSANGTFVNGQRVRSQMALQSGDLLGVGTCQFVVDLGDLNKVWPAEEVNPMTTTLKLPPNLGEQNKS
jgi:pSer/pThr/pTyr-binding forkhead associated (FHA) protein